MLDVCLTTSFDPHIKSLSPKSKVCPAAWGSFSERLPSQSSRVQQREAAITNNTHPHTSNHPAVLDSYLKNVFRSFPPFSPPCSPSPVQIAGRASLYVSMRRRHSSICSGDPCPPPLPPSPWQLLIRLFWRVHWEEGKRQHLDGVLAYIAVGETRYYINPPLPAELGCENTGAANQQRFPLVC